MANENRPTTLRLTRQRNVPTVAASSSGQDVIPNLTNNLHFLMFTARAAGGAVLTRAQLITDIARVRVWLGSTLLFNLNTTAILDLYKYYYDKWGALAAPLGTLVIPFTRPRLATFDAGRVFALGLAKDATAKEFETLSYAVDYTAGLVTAASISLQTACDIYDPEPCGLHIRTLEVIRTNTATGDEQLADLNRNCVGVLAYHWGAGTIATFSVYKNGVQIHRNVDALAPYQIVLDMANRTPQTNYFHLDFAATPSANADDLNGFEALGKTVTEWLVVPNWSAAEGAGYVLTCEEIHDGING
jgi:hypothetical protein